MSTLKTAFILSVLTLLLLTGCSAKYDVKVTEVFRSNILDDDAKMFTYSIIFVNRSSLESKGDDSKGRRSKEGRQGRNKGGNNRPNKQGGEQKESLESYMTEVLETRLIEKLEDNNYCRKGYFELERTLNKSIYTIQGECSESATSEDRQRFIK